MTPSALIALIQDAANSAAQTPAAGAAPSTGTAPITDPPAAGGGWTQSLMSFLPMIAIFAIFYFVLIGPERKNRKRHRKDICHCRFFKKVFHISLPFYKSKAR